MKDLIESDLRREETAVAFIEFLLTFPPLLPSRISVWAFLLCLVLMCPTLFKLEEITARSCLQSEEKKNPKPHGHLTQLLAACEACFYPL